MAHVFVACPKCGAAYKMSKDHLSTPAVCRSCGHRWVPAEGRREGAEGPEAAPPAPAEGAPQPAAEPATQPPAKEAEPEPPAPAPPSPEAKTPEGEIGSPLDALAAMAAAHDAGKGPADQAESQEPEPVEAEAVTPEPVPVDEAPKPAPRRKPPAPAKPPAPPPAPAKQPAPPEPPEEIVEAEPAEPEEAEPADEKPAASDALAAMAQAVQGGAPSKPPKAEKRAHATPAAAGEGPAKPAAPKRDALVSRHVNGFKIQQRIGTGGFGVVYRAFDTNLERSVAIKMLPPNLAKAGKGVVQRFLREARSAAKLAHPNITTIHQICPYEDTYYIVMELIEGGTLHDQMARGHMTPDEATRIIRAAAEGLGHAHKRGIIHRDIKPGNIMLTRDGQVKVSDFGLARDVLQGKDIVGAGHSLGTPRYMAPEQALGEEPSAASDLYSLAATYFVLLTGRSAFDGTSDREIMRKQVQDPVPDPRQFRPNLPVAVYRFFEKAMAKEPDDRYTTADVFIEALDRLDFSQAAGELSDSQDLASQLGAVAAEERGSHLSQTLGRAVRRAQRQGTPVSETAVGDLIGAGKAAGRKAGWKLWVIIGVVALLIVGGAVTAAILLAPGRGGGKPGPKPETPGTKTPGTETPTTPTTPGTETPGTETPTTPAEKPPETLTESPLEAVAQEVLKEVEVYEADLDTPVYELIRMYRENVMQVYPGTKAAKTAEQAIKRLRKGKRLGEGGAPPAEETPKDVKPKPERPGDETPAEK